MNINDNKTNITTIKNKIIYKNKSYSLSRWYASLSTFRVFNKDSIIVKNQIDLDTSYIRDIFLTNVNKTTKYGLILPCNLFLVVTCLISWISLKVYNNANFINIDGRENIFVFMVFLAVFFFTSFIILLIKIIKKDKIYLTYVRNNLRQKNISNKEYLNMLDVFDGYINKDYIYFKPISSTRLVIRELNIDDEEAYFNFGKNANNFTYMNMNYLKNISEARDLILKTTEEYSNNLIFKLALALKDENSLIGYIGLSKYDLSLYTCQIVYAIDEAHWGKGYASEAVSLFVGYLKSIGKKLIIAGHVEENMASGKVLLKNGFIRDPNRDTTMVIHGEIKKIINYKIDERT